MLPDCMVWRAWGSSARRAVRNSRRVAMGAVAGAAAADEDDGGGEGVGADGNRWYVHFVPCEPATCP